MEKSLDTPREIVKADNALFRSRSRLKDVLSGRIFMAFASLVDEKDVAENGNFLEYSISAASILDKNTGGDNYKQLREAAYHLVDQKIERRTGKNSFKLYTLFSTIEYKDGIIIGEFHKDLKPFFITALCNFTRLSLKDYLNLQSIYSQKIFGFLKSWDDKPEITIEVEELHRILETPISLKTNFKDFRRRVLEQSYKDITKKTSLKYEYETIRTGRKITSIRFIFSKKISLPVMKKKYDDTVEKKSRQNNKFFIIALDCIKEHGSACTGGHQTEHICDICRRLR